MGSWDIIHDERSEEWIIHEPIILWINYFNTWLSNFCKQKGVIWYSKDLLQQAQ